MVTLHDEMLRTIPIPNLTWKKKTNNTIVLSGSYSIELINVYLKNYLKYVCHTCIFLNITPNSEAHSHGNLDKFEIFCRSSIITPMNKIINNKTCIYCFNNLLIFSNLSAI